MSLTEKVNNNKNSVMLIDFGRCLHLIWKNLIYVVLFAAIIGAGAYVAVQQITPTYQATAVLRLKDEERQAITLEEVVGIDSTKKEYYATQEAILQSNEVAQRVIDSLSLYDHPEFISENDERGSLDQRRQKILSKFKSNLTISLVRGTQLVEVTYESPDPELAALIANSVGEAYIASDYDRRLNKDRASSEWINTRLDELRIQLGESEQTLTEFLQNEGLTEDAGGLESNAAVDLKELTIRLNNATERRIESESLYNELRIMEESGELEYTDIDSIAQNPRLRDTSLARNAAEQSLASLSERYGPRHERILQAKAEIALLKEREEDIITKLKSSIYKDFRATSLQEELLRKELFRKKREIQVIAEKRNRYLTLKAEVDSDKKLYNQFLLRLKEISANSDFATAIAEVHDVASVPYLPSKPKKLILIALAVIAAGGLYMVVVLVWDIIRSGVYSKTRFEEEFNILPVASIRKSAGKPIEAQGIAKKHQARFEEAIVGLRTSIILNDQQSKVTLITSCVKGEGGSTVAKQLALSFAKVEKTLLIDGNLLNPSVEKGFMGISAEQKGISDLLLNNASIDECIYLDESGLSIMTVGTMLSDNLDSVLNHQLNEKLTLLSEKFDRIIIDNSSINPAGSSLIIGEKVGSTYLVVGCNSTKRSLVKQTFTQLDNHNIKLKGVVLNKSDMNA
ncbi:polysaccharide biosynthesis tyrosine autokinase [Vibrio sp.]|nr:polysaccharide biosynthesis tyrosine autokinase [Vibrio sp.]